MKVTLIGGNGHVGRFLAPTLRSRGHKVLVADLSVPAEGIAGEGIAGQQVRANALSASQVRAAIAGADLVVHMAVVLLFTDDERLDPDLLSSAYGVNVGSVMTCLEQCRDLDTPMVHISSMSVFNDYGRVPVDASGVGDACDYYGFTKRLAEFACQQFAAQFPVRVTSLRLAFPTPDEHAPGWMLPRTTTVVQQHLDDGTPVAALSASQLCGVLETCLDMPVGHRVLPVTAAPQTLEPQTLARAASTG